MQYVGKWGMSKKLQKHPGGRPTKYKPEVIIELNEYLQEAIPENMAIPTVEGIALKLGISKKTLYNWAKKNPEFLHALGKLKMMQKEALVKTGIFGGKEINQAIVGLLLKVNHKMSDQAQTNIQINVKPILGGIAEVVNVQTDDSDKEVIEIK